MSIDGLSASPATVAVGASVNVSVSVSYGQCKGGSIQFGDNAPAGLAYAGCSTASSDWDCGGVYASNGARFSVYVPGNNGNKSAVVVFSYTASSAGNRSIVFTEYQSQTSAMVNITVTSGTPPTVTSQAATAISLTGATLNGSVSSNGASTTVSFEYGLTLAYGSTVSAAQSPLASGASGTAVSAALSGLSCGSTYQFRIKGANSAGTSNGANQSFTTTSCTPLAEYRFDECSLSGAAGEIKDSSGYGRHLSAQRGASIGKTTPGILNNQADLRDTTGKRYFTPVTPFALGSSWTLSTWVKFPLSTGGSRYHVLAAVAGGGDLMYMDDQDGLRWGVYTPGNITAGSYKLGSLTAGWHHLALVGSGSSTALYINGSLIDSVNNKASGNLAFIGASYDVDAGTNEGMNALMDEFMVFNGALSLGEIQSVIANQAIGSNWDGSSRPGVSCGPSSFNISGTGSASTCTAQTLTITARDASGNTLSSYTGTVSISTSSGKGNWSAGSSPAPAGTLTAGAANSGLATYQFAAGDSGVVKLSLSHTLAQDVTVTVADAAAAGSSSTSAAIQYRDNAFVFAEDISNKVSGSDIAVAGRPHDHTLSYIRRDPVTGSCGVATDYTGNKTLKFWRSDSGGSWVAPTVVSPALSIPAAQPASNNLTLSFTSGVASFNLGTTDIGRYSLNARDDTLGSAANAITGSGNILTVRPFTVLVSAIKYGATNNPNGSAFTDALFAPAGANFAATAAAYLWNAAMLSNGADAGNTGSPASTASEAAMKVGGLSNSFASAVSLSPLAGSQTPTSGTLGSLNNGSIAGASFASGTATVATLQYTEVGSFALNTTGVVSNFLGSGLALNAVVVNASGVQNSRVGRFVPASFALTSPTVSHRNGISCAPASTFSYLDENFRLQFTLTAKNALGGTTTNYTGAFALLDLAAPASFGLAGIQGSTTFKTTNSRLALVSSSGSWASGVAANVQLIAAAKRAAAPDGPFDSARFGIAATDNDGVTLSGLDLDTDSPANGNDRVLLATVPLRFGRLQLMNAIGAQNRDLALPLLAQYWNGSGFADNTLDSCTRIDSANVNFANYRKNLNSSDSTLLSSPVTVSAGRARLVLSRPGGARSGSFDVALSLSSAAAASTCMAAFSPGVGDAATAGAGMAYLRGAWCGSAYDKDPSARATFGLYRGADNLIYQRENY